LSHDRRRAEEVKGAGVGGLAASGRKKSVAATAMAVAGSSTAAMSLSDLRA
jgi:hypothetical protein